MSVTMGISGEDSFINTVKEGNRLYYAGRFEEALGEYQKALTYRPSSLLTSFNIGVVRYKKGEYSAAEREFSKLLAMIEPGLRVNCLFNIGNSRYYRKDYRGAVASFKEVLKLNPKDRDARYNLDLSLRALKRMEREKSTPISPGHHPVEGGEDVKDIDVDVADEEAEGMGGGSLVKTGEVGSIGGMGTGTSLDEVEKFTEEEAEEILDGLRELEMNALKEARRARIPRVTMEKDW